MARQLVTGNVDVGLLSAAGQPQNLVGEAIAGAGAAIGGFLEAALQKGSDKKDGLDSQEKEDDKKAEFTNTGDGTDKLNNQAANLANKTIGGKTSLEGLLINQEGGGIQERTGGLYSKKEAWNLNLEGIRQKYTDFAAYQKDKATDSDITEEKRKYGESIGLKYNEDRMGEDFLKWKSSDIGKSVLGGSPRLKDDNPLLRRKTGRSNPNVNNLARVWGGGSTTATTQNAVPTTNFDSGRESGYTEGRTYVEKVRRLSAPSWMGVGTAAVEGYNLGVDRENYRRQVSADLQDYFEDKFADAEVESSGNDLLDASLKELSYKKKLEFTQHYKDRSLAIKEGRFNEWNVKNDMLNGFAKEAKTLQEGVTTLRNTLKEGAENDTYDWEASGPAATDRALTFMKDGSIVGAMEREDGSLAIGGATPGGIGYIKSVKGFLKDPLKLVEKKNAFDYVSSVTAEFERLHGDKFTTTQDANGNLIKKPINMEAIKPYLMRMFDAELDTEATTRAYASRSNWDDKGLDYDSFNTHLKNGINPKDIVKENMYAAAVQLMNPYQAQYEESVTGVSTARENERITIDKENRAEAREQAENDNSGGSGSGGNGKDSTGKNGKNSKEDFGTFQVNEFFKSHEAWVRNNVGPHFKYSKNRKDSKGKDIDGIIEIPDEQGQYGTPGAQTFDMNREEDIEQLLKIHGSQAGGKGGDEFAMQVSKAIEKRKADREAGKSTAKKIEEQDISKYDFELNKIL